MSDALSALGYDEAIAAWITAFPGAVPARVSRTDRGGCAVLGPDGEGAVALQRSDDVVTGDWVALAEGRLAGVAPRHGTLTRADPSSPGTGQVLAANVDLVFVVAGADRPRKAGKVERATVLAWEAGAQPVLVLTKADLLDDPAGAVTEAAAMAPGVDLFVTSAVTGEGCAELAGLVAGGRTAALLGESGSGKSTLVNRLAGREVLATSAVRDGDRKGRHTTTARHLVPLPGGGVLLDTPGLRQIGLWPSGSEEGLATAFADVEALVGGCRFDDCGHRSEPGCAVLAAVEDGRLPARRLAAYVKLQRELEWQSGAISEHQRRVDSRRFGKMAKAVMAEKERSRRGR